MQFKKGNALVCVNNKNAETWLTKGKKYTALQDQMGEHVLIMDDQRNECHTQVICFALAESHIELSTTLSIELSILETCVQLLDEIRKPSVSYHRDASVMMQSVIDQNTANAEMVANYLKQCLPKTTESLS